MRFLWLHSHFLIWAGGTRFVFEVARRVHRRTPVDMVVERCSDDVRRMYEAEGMTVTELGRRSSESYLYWSLFPWFVQREVRKLRALPGPYSAVVSSMFPMNLLAGLARPEPHLTYVMEPFAFFHDADMVAGFPPMQRAALRALGLALRPVDVAAVRRADAVMTINDGVARWVKAVYGRDPSLSLLGVDAETFAPRDDERARALRARYAGRKVVIHSTDFTPLKRTDAAIAAVEAIRGAVPEALLLVTCSFDAPGPIEALRSSIRARGLADHVEVVGHVSHGDLPYYYALADVSLYTGVGRGASAASLFVLECMASGTPGIRTDFTREEIEHEVSGLLFDAADDQALRASLLRLLSDDAFRARCGRAARERVLRRYSWDAVADRVHDALVALAGASAARAAEAGR